MREVFSRTSWGQLWDKGNKFGNKGNNFGNKGSNFSSERLCSSELRNVHLYLNITKYVFIPSKTKKYMNIHSKFSTIAYSCMKKKDIKDLSTTKIFKAFLAETKVQDDGHR